MTLIKYDKKAALDLEELYVVVAQDKKSAADKFINAIDKYVSFLYKIYKTHISVKRVINSKQNYKGKQK